MEYDVEDVGDDDDQSYDSQIEIGEAQIHADSELNDVEVKDIEQDYGNCEP